MRRGGSLGRFLPFVLLLTAPAGALLLVLALAGLLHPLAALAAAAALPPLTWLVLRRFVTDQLAVAQHLRALADDGAARPPEVSSDIAAEQLAAVAQLRRSWQQARADLEAAAASTEATLDSLPDPLFLLDRQRRVLRANLAARKLFGGVAGSELASFLRDPALLDAVQRVLGGRSGEEVELMVAGAVERSFRCRVEPLPARARDGSVAVLALHDVTALARMERMRADFVANASHELRTPLAALLGFIETLQGPARDDEQARERFLAIMQQQAARMSRLVDDLLSLSRIELDEHTQPAGAVALAPLLAQITEALAPQAERRRVRLVVVVEPGLPAVTGNADELTQVFQNLVDNAIKYGRDDAPVEVTARRAEAGMVVVEVRDHGEGIPRAHLPRLTERFYRVDTARSRTMGGTGLGLAIVKHVVNRHRGKLVIESMPGEGSVFSVHLPAALPKG